MKLEFGYTIVLFFLVNLQIAWSDITLIDLRSNETVQTYNDREANFGPEFPNAGLTGKAIGARPSHACSPIEKPPNMKDVWIAIISRGDCEFSDKIKHAAMSGYQSAIVTNYKNNDTLMTMKNGSDVTIPSVFVGWTTGRELNYSYPYTDQYIIKISEEPDFAFKVYLWPFAIVLAICFLIIMIILVIKFVRDYGRSRIARLSKKHLKKIPIKKYKKGDYYDTCAICLDEYEEGEKIRVLPCSHVYHCKCIDPWLTKNKKTCPVCKRRVMPGRSADSESDSDEDGANGNNERTPLLAGAAASTQSGSIQTARLESGGLRTLVSAASTAPQETQTTNGFVNEGADEFDNLQEGAVGGVGISEWPQAALLEVDEQTQVEEPSHRERKKRHREDKQKRPKKSKSKKSSRRQIQTPNTSEVNTDGATQENPLDGVKDTQNLLVHTSGTTAATTDRVLLPSGTSEPGVLAGPMVHTSPTTEPQEDYINPSYSESQEVPIPSQDSTQEMNPIV